MAWTVNNNKRVQKQVEQLPQKIQDILLYLIRELEEYGPVRGNWLNYSPLGKNRHHCHLKKGKPTYVVTWEIVDKKAKVIEVSYVGTHEKAPY